MPRPRSALQQPVKHDGARGLGEGRQFTQRILGIFDAVRVHADEHDVLDAQLPVLDLGDVVELGAQAGNATQCGALLAIQLLAVEIDGARLVVVQSLGTAVAEAAHDGA